MKLAGIGLGVLIVAVGLGFFWGASGRGTAEDAVAGLRHQLDIAEARGSILDARVSLYNVNFGDAQQKLEEAKTPLTKARDRAQEDGRRQAADAFAAALTHLEEAQRLASKLDPAANNKAGEALKSIETAAR
jgi:hypothetical protein